jgi:hypothetical protein
VRRKGTGLTVKLKAGCEIRITITLKETGDAPLSEFVLRGYGPPTHRKAPKIERAYSQQVLHGAQHFGGEILLRRIRSRFVQGEGHF